MQHRIRHAAVVLRDAEGDIALSIVAPPARLTLRPGHDVKRVPLTALIRLDDVSYR